MYGFKIHCPEVQDQLPDSFDSRLRVPGIDCVLEETHGIPGPDAANHRRQKQSAAALLDPSELALLAAT